MIGFSRFAAATVKRSTNTVNYLSTLHGSSSSSPLIENYRSTWPDPEFQAPHNILAAAPVRTVPDSALGFIMTATLNHGSSIFYPHMDIHPSDCKVKLQVNHMHCNRFCSSSHYN